MSAQVEIPLFPLSNVVIFPGVQTPLHLFEPRYRQMAEHSLAGSRQIGMVTVPPEHVDQMSGEPPVYPVGCAGSIAQSQRLPDGRYDIVLAGTRRFRIVEELPRSGRLYRVARVELLDDPFPAESRERVSQLRERIIALMRSLIERASEGSSAKVGAELFRGVDDASFVNSLSNALVFAPAEKQGLLEADSIPQRFDRLEGLLSFRLAELARPGVSGSRSVH